LSELIALQADISRDKNRSMKGQSVEVLIEGVSDKNPARLAGRTRGNKLVQFPGKLSETPAGTLVEVQTQEGFLWGFTGEMTRLLEPKAKSRTLLELTVL
jgi:tRNA-2-methylthio-N6-dimethylallyladenosine synthase